MDEGMDRQVVRAVRMDYMNERMIGERTDEFVGGSGDC